MVALNENEKKVLAQIWALPPDRRQVVLELAKENDLDAAWKRNQKKGEARLRQLASEKGIDWDKLDDEGKQDFVEELFDEDEK